MSNNNGRESGFHVLWSKVLSVFNRSKDEVVRSSKVSKARLDLSSLKNEKERAFERLGEEIYRKHKENKISIPGLDSVFTEIDIINLKLSSKERELKGLKGEAAVPVPSNTVRGLERQGRPQRPKRKSPPHAKLVTSPAVSEEGKQESGSRPKKTYYRHRRRPSEVNEAKIERSNNMGL